MNILNKVSKKLRWLRWSTIFAILFYMFFIGLILHNTTYKLQNSLKSQPSHQHHQHKQPLFQQLRSTHGKWRGRDEHRNQPNGNNVLPLNYKTKASLSRTVQAAAAPSASLSSSSSSSSSSSLMYLPVDNGDGSSSSSVRIDVTTLKRHKSYASPETVILVASSVNEKQILEKAFRRADKNRDNLLNIQELAQYINKNIVDHIDEAIRLNPREFRRVDITPADGLITWDEYHRFFLKEHGMTEADIDEHNEIKHTGLNRKAREDMMRDKARWSEAARTDLFTLTIDEYLSFRHPESSISNLLELVDDLLRQFDQDGDEQLTIEEFSEVSGDDDDDLIRKSLISKTVVERREEFKRIIDKNHDGKADRGELLNYVNPKTPRYALQEAATLFSLCDENHDNKLSLDEMAANAEIFLTSKMIDTAHSFHTEF
ncbi:45 kDa calcium-binding protein isoform X1 [Glossina fuscipes]|uniref:45 kDa calcium-binding protein isoform X1 n=1 Tax=Glossina fuscipes TaxID=7396 RepID=A0A9C5ZA48_9MUSC|nr:45 kDa calcium-binding protein isoform X1 [Glossina fuscipes]